MMPKVSPPCTADLSSIFIPVSAYAAAPISSKNTNMSKTSPDSAKPLIPAANSSMSAWNRPLADSTYRQL